MNDATQGLLANLERLKQWCRAQDPKATVWLHIDEAIRAISTPAAVEADGWRSIDSAPRDGNYILAEVAENDSLTFCHQVGRLFVIRHEGKTVSGYDLGWAVYPGYGGAPDSFFSRWQPIPLASPAPRDTSGVEAAVEQGYFLTERIEELDWSSGWEQFATEWHGHVEPALSRFRASLATLRERRS